MGERRSEGAVSADAGVFIGDSESARRLRALDWAQIPWGPPSGWPASLRAACRIALASRFPMVVWWGPDLRLIYNDDYAHLIGDKHPALGEPGADVWPDIWHIVGPMLRSVLSTGEATWSADVLLPMRRRGYWEETYWTFSYSPLHDDDGGVGGVFTAVTEMTQRVVGERRLAALQDLGAQAGRARTVDEACELVLGALARADADIPFAALHLLGPDATFAAPAGSHPAPLAGGPGDWPLEEALASDAGLEIDDVRARFGDLPTGAWDHAPTEAVLLPLRGETGAAQLGVVVLGVSAGRELDEPYRRFLDLVAAQSAALLNGAIAYQAQQERAEELSELDRAKTAFFSTVSHEFRTPLTLIMGPLEELRDRPDLDAVPGLADELERAHRNCRRLGRLVDTLLDFSRLQAGRLTARYEPVELGRFTADLAGTFSEAVRRAGLEFTVDCPDQGVPVHVDPEMWEQVVLNLLSNALKFTFTGSIAVTLRRDGPGHVVLSVADTGTGIREAEVPRLFERFHRVEGARSRSVEGSGIGLAMVHELVALHGGEVTVSSAVDAGTEFRVRLPLGTAHLPADRIAEPAPSRRPVLAASFVGEALRWLPDADDRRDTGDGTGPTGTGGRVLVADDNADMRDYLTRLLAPHYDVRTVSHGRAALDAALAEPPDLLISDVMMPELDGMALLAALRAEERTAQVPVLLLSARAGQEAAVQGLAAGADDYLIKPFSARELLARVAARLDLSRVRRDAERRRTLLAALGRELDAADGDAGMAVAARLLVDAGLADRCSVRLLEPDGTDGTQLRRVAGAATDPAVEAIMAGLPGESVLAREVIDTGRPVVEPSWSPGVVAVVGLPLRARGRVRGVLALGRLGGAPGEKPGAYDEDEVALFGEVAARIGMALDNALLLAEERVAAHRLDLLHRATAELSAAATPDQVVEVTRRHVSGLLASPAVGVWERGSDDATGSLQAARLDGWDPTFARDWAVVPLAGAAPVADAARDGRVVLLERAADWEREYPHLRDVVAATGYRSLAVWPLVVAAECLGALAVGFERPRVLRSAERATALALAEQCAQALQRARLLRAESDARRAAVRLGAALAALSAATDLGGVGRVLLDQMIGLGAAAAVVALRVEDHLEVLAAIGFADGSSSRPAPGGPLATAADRGEPVWSAAAPDRWGAPSGDPYPVDAALPLMVAGSCIGTVGLRWATGPPGADTRSLLVTLAGQSAQALDRARLQQAEHEVAVTLQRVLLPGTTPSLDRLAVATRYLPGAAGTVAGGDWYDVIPLADGRVAIVVGDVVGQGPRAAAVMGQLRSALAAYLIDDHEPAEALERLDRFARRVDGAAASTVACMVLDRSTGELRWARAGHVPALVIDGDGVRFLLAGGGTVLGVRGRPPFTEERTVLEPGACVLLYTDGLVERRGESVDDGLDRLAAAAAGLRDRDPERLATDLLVRCLGEGPADDVALVAIRLLPAPLHGHRHADPVELGDLRREVRGWAGDAALHPDQLDDLQLALGEAVANAVEHAYPAGAPGGVGYSLSVGPDGAVAVEVRDRGRWRPPPEDPGHRGRGLLVIDRIADDVTVEGTAEGTVVRFVVPPTGDPRLGPAAGPDPGRESGVDPGLEPRRRPGPRRPSRLVHRAPVAGVAQLDLSGDLDLLGVRSVQGPLLAAVATGPAVVDVSGVGHVGSAGVALLLEATHATPGAELEIRAAPGSVADRILRIAGLIR